MRIRHVAFVVSDLERSGMLFEDALGFARVGLRTPGNFPGQALDLTDGEVNLSLLCPSVGVPSAWSSESLGPIHVGIVVADLEKASAALEKAGIEVYATKDDPPTFFKFRDYDGIEFDVASEERHFPTQVSSLQGES